MTPGTEKPGLVTRDGSRTGDDPYTLMTITSKLRIALLLSVALNSLAAEIATLNFENALPLTLTGGAGISVGNHAVPRLIDWNDDGALDLLVAGGDGYLWLFRQPGATDSSGFQPGERITSAGTQIRVGTGYTGACFVDVNHDGLKDLVAAGTDHRLRFYPNVGTTTEPRWEGFTIIRGAAGDFVIPSDVLGRFDLGDWDGDGDLDLITGDFEGYLTWYKNTGSVWAPEFASAGVRLTRGNATIHEPYNTHPRIFDFNQDGILDLAYGINWGYVKILISEAVGATDFRQAFLLRDAAGLELNIRPLNNDDTTPDFADLTGDGILDLISGGFNGRLFVLPGISPLTPTLQQIDGIMAAHPDALGAALNQDSVLRQTLFGLHQSLRETALTILPVTERERLRDWYCDHIALYPQYLTKRPLDPTTDAFVPYLAGQVWINLFESMPDTFEHRQLTANAAGLTGIHYDLLLDLGILYIENSRSTPASQQVLYDIAASIPTPLQIVEVVTQNDYLKTSSGGSMSLKARAGVNVFAQVGDYSEGFPPQVPQTRIDGFSVVVAHELNHNVELAARRRYSWYDDRKHTLLEQAAPPHLVFKDHRTASFGLDLPATQAVFLAQGFWDGDPASWAAAYNDYWSSGAGTGFERHWLRDNLKLCIEAPQEAFATLANQYFCSSDVMLQLAVTRWNEGITHGIQQFLFFADVYSLGGNDTRFYRVDTAGQVTTSRPSLTRDEKGHIIGLTTPTTQYIFTVDAEGNVLDLSVNPNPDNVAFTVTANQGTVTITGYTGPGGEVVIPDTINGLPVTGVGGHAFAYLTNLTGVVIPDSITSIGNDAFKGCTELTSATIGEGVIVIGEGAFQACWRLTSINIPSSVFAIGRWAFATCTGLTSLVIPDGVVYIGDEAFHSCVGLTNVSIPRSVTSIGYWALGDCTSLTEISVDPRNPNYTSMDGVLFGYDQTELIQCPGGRTGSYTVPESVVTIGDHAFARCTGLTSITIPNSVVSVGNHAFALCAALTSIVVPDSVINLGESSFLGCTGLTSITIPDSVITIGSWAFENCADLASVVIGHGVASIGYGVFWDCLRLTAVYFEGDTPEMPDDSAFDGSQAIIFYLPGTVGWGPTFGGRPTMPWSLTPGDLDGDGEIDRDDLDVIVAARNTESWGPEDPRDLDGDGSITVLDARIVVTLFTVPAGFTRIASNPEGVVVEWNENASAMKLQSTTDLQGGIWQDVGGLQSPTNKVIGTTSERTFFRLVLPE